MRRTFNNSRNQLKEQTTSQDKLSPQKFGLQTMDSI